MQCPSFSDQTHELFESLVQMDNDVATKVTQDPGKYLNIIMGMQPEYASFESMVDIWLLTGDTISNIYRCVTKERV